MATKPLVLILEDDLERVRRFGCAINAAGWRMRVWGNARFMLADLRSVLLEAVIISLDHDLVGAGDPGDGMMVVEYLVASCTRLPVVVHSSNSERANIMVGEFELAAWECKRVLPFGDDWIEREWVEVVKSMIAGP